MELSIDKNPISGTDGLSILQLKDGMQDLMDLWVLGFHLGSTNKGERVKESERRKDNRVSSP